jgi:hypothetical protein
LKPRKIICPYYSYEDFYKIYCKGYEQDFDNYDMKNNFKNYRCFDIQWEKCQIAKELLIKDIDKDTKVNNTFKVRFIKSKRLNRDNSKIIS